MDRPHELERADVHLVRLSRRLTRRRSGAQLGKPAERNPVHAPQVVTVHPGQSGYGTVGFPNPGNYPPGKCTAESASMRVYPPDELRSLVTGVHEAYCPGFTVSAITATKQ